jgi:hypothetical protein
MDITARCSLLAALRFLTAVTVVVWRVCSRPLAELWRDWMVLLALYCVFWPPHQEAPSAKRVATVALAAYLLGIFAAGQIRNIFSVLTPPP